MIGCLIHHRAACDGGGGIQWDRTPLKSSVAGRTLLDGLRLAASDRLPLTPKRPNSAGLPQPSCREQIGRISPHAVLGLRDMLPETDPRRFNLSLSDT